MFSTLCSSGWWHYLFSLCYCDVIMVVSSTPFCISFGAKCLFFTVYKVVTIWFDPFFGSGYNVHPSAHKQTQIFGRYMGTFRVFLGAFEHANLGFLRLAFHSGSK